MNDRRLRVVLFLGGFPDADRPHRSPFNLRAAKLLQREVDLTVCVLRGWLPGRTVRERFQYEGVPVVALAAPQLPRFTNFNMSVFRAFGWPFARTLLQDADVVHSVDAAGIGTVAGRWARRAGVPHVTQVIQNMTVVPHLRNRGREWGRDFDAVACNSAALAAEFRSRWPDVPNVQVVHRGVDLSVYTPAGETLPALTAKPARTRFAYFGGFPTYSTLPHGANTKGGFVLLDAWKRAEAEMHAHDAMLVIGGPDCDREDVRAWHRSLQHPARVDIVGIMTPTDVPAALRSADAVIVPSLHEGLPNVAVEASACARPVIGSSIEPMREVVADGETGTLVPPGDAVALRDALVAAARDRESLRLLGHAARVKMERDFDHARYATKMLAIYRSVARTEVR